MAAAAPNSGSNVAIGVRLNNPLNIRHNAANNWDGQIGSDGGFSQFESVGHGYRAADKLLDNYGKLHGISTLAGAIDRWAPPNENDTAKYIEDVASWTGLDPNAQLDLNDPTVRRSLLSAMTRKETGQIISANDILGHINRLASLQPTTQQPTPQRPTTRQPTTQQPTTQQPQDFWLKMAGEVQTGSAGNLGDLGANIQSTSSPSAAQASPTDEFFAGASIGIRGASADLNYFAALANTMIGDADAAAANIERARTEEAASAQLMGSMEQFEGFVENPTFSGFFTQLLSGMGQITPMALSSIGTAMTGAVVQAGGKALLASGGRSAAKKIIDDTLRKAAEGAKLSAAEDKMLEGAYASLKKADLSASDLKVGAAAGAFASEYPLAAGSSFSEFGEAGQEMNSDRALQSLMIGAPVAAIGVFSEAILLSSVLDVAKDRAAKTASGSLMREFAARLGSVTATSAASEGITETVQEGIGVAQRFSTDDTYTAEQAQMRLGQAAFLGFFGGGAFAGAAGTPAAGYGALKAGAIFQQAEAKLKSAQENRTADQMSSEQMGIDPSAAQGVATEEAQSDLTAQFEVMSNESSSKHAVWQSGMSSGLEPNVVHSLEEASNGETTGYLVEVEGKGTLVTQSRAIAEQVLKSGADEESLRIALGYSAIKPIDADRAVRVIDAKGNVVSEEMTNAAGEEAAIAAAAKIAVDDSFTIDTVSTVQALEERQARASKNKPRVRKMSGNPDIDEADVNEQGGSFTTEAQERELSEGFNEIDEFETEEVNDYAVGSPARRTDAGIFENNWTEILQLVPPEERAKIAALEPLASESFAKSFLAYLKSDPGYYAVEQRGDRLFITRKPDSADTLLSGASKESIAQQREGARISRLTKGYDGKPITALTANGKLFLRDEKGLPVKGDKRLPADYKGNYRAKLDKNIFTVETPDGNSTPINIGDVIAAGRDINVGSQTALVGETLSPEQSAKAALIRGLAELADRGYKVSFFGKPLNFTLDTANPTAAVLGQPDLFNSQSELTQMSAGAQAQITSRQWVESLSRNDAKFFNDLIVFQQGKGQSQKSFSLNDILSTKDPIPKESVAADQKVANRPKRALAAAEQRIEFQIKEYIDEVLYPLHLETIAAVNKYTRNVPLTPREQKLAESYNNKWRKFDRAAAEDKAREIANDPEADRLDIYTQQEMENIQANDVAFAPPENDINSQAQTEAVVGFQSPSESLTPDADALKRMSNWRNEELQRQREAMNAGTRSVVTPAALEAEIDAQLPAKREEFLAEAEAKLLQTPSGTNSETDNPFTGSGTTVGGSIELEDQIEQQQLQGAKDAGVLDADGQVDPDPEKARAAERKQTKLDEDQFRRRQKLSRTGGRIDVANESGVTDKGEKDKRPTGEDITFEGMTDEEKQKEQRRRNRTVQRDKGTSTHPSRLIIEDGPKKGGWSAVQAAARGFNPSRVIPQQDIDFNNTRTKLTQKQIEQKTEIIGDIGGAAQKVLGKALKIFKQQISKPVSVYTYSEWRKATEAPINKQFQDGEIDAETRNYELDQLDQMMRPENYGAVFPYENRYVIVLRDQWADGDVAGIEERMAAVLGHEIGHMIFDQEIKRLTNSASSLMDALQAAFLNDINLKFDVREYDGRGGFEEWYADQVASYLYDSSKRATNQTQSYFKRIAAKMREMFQAVNEFLGGRLSANQDFRTYIKDLVEANRKNIKLYDDYTGSSHLDAVDKMVIRNWNGQVFDQVPSKAVSGAKSVYERTMRSGTGSFLMKWVTASDNYLRSMGEHGVELAQFFQATSQSGERTGFHHDKQRNENIFLQKLAKAMGVNPNRADLWATDEINEVLQEAEDETINTEDLKDPRSRAVRRVFEQFHATYLLDEQGRPYFQVRQRKNYAPRLINFHGLEETPEMRESLAQLLVKYPNTQKTDEFGEFQLTIEQARKLVDEILADPTENPDVAQNPEYLRRREEAVAEARTPEERAQIIKDFQLSEQEARDEDRGHIAPGFRNSLARSLGAIPTKELRAIDALAPPVLAFTQYFHHATRRVEFEKRGGEAEIRRIINLIPEEYQQDALNAVRANLGRVGIGSKPWLRNLNSIDAVWTSTTTLLFTAFTSFTDMAGPIIRSKDFAGMGRAFSEINKTLSTNENRDLTRAVGVASAEAAANIFMAAGELDYANSTARKILDKFFYYSGLQLYTRFSREFAAGMGREFLLDVANRVQTETTLRWLDELEISQEQILAWDSGDGSFDTPEGRAVAKAIAKFVDESIVRPNAAERPLWASHPMAMVVWRLKSYFYSFGKVVLGGMGREMKNRYREDGDFRGAGMVLALAMGTMLPLAAFGMEMKELTKWMLQALIPGIEATGKTFRSDHMNAPEYLATLVEKSGALGPWSIPLSIIQSAQWGDNPIVSQVPIVDLADATLLEGNWTRPIPLINNID